MTEAPLLAARGLEVWRGGAQVLHGVDCVVAKGGMTCLLGANGAGKTTLLMAVMGMLEMAAGRVLFDGQDVTGWTVAARVRAGMVAVAEGRRLFARMTVRDNLAMGAFVHGRLRGPRFTRDLERAYALFPRLAERDMQLAGTLSGGEQQMVAMARALMARPRVLCLDEPSMGLSPLLVGEMFALLGRIRAEGIAVLIVEQHASMALAASEQGCVLQEGRVVMSGDARALARDPAIRAAYLGGAM